MNGVLSRWHCSSKIIRVISESPKTRLAYVMSIRHLMPFHSHFISPLVKYMALFDWIVSSSPILKIHLVKFIELKFGL